MAGVLRFSLAEWGPMTLRQLTTCFDASILHDWDQTATLSALTHNLTVTLQAVNGVKGGAKPKSFYDFHPYRENNEPEGCRITPENFDVLRLIGDALVNQK